MLDENLMPNPDYWLSYVFKKLIGNVVFPLPRNDHFPLFRYYAHGNCVNGRVAKVTFYSLNLSPNETVRASLSNMPGIEDTVNVFMLTPGEGGLLSQTVLLNGKPMKMVDDSTMPELKPMVYPKSRDVLFPPRTIGFIQGTILKNHKQFMAC